jgi:tetratricopeptide (TPR) repeat protein
MPNAQNIPVSSLHTNIWYHLGLAYYLKHDLENALRVYRKGIEASTNDDMFIATMHWLYMTLRLMGQDDEAEQVLEPVHAEMNIIENMAYHRLCLFYKGELAIEELTGQDDSSIMDDAVAYGLGNWHFYNGNADEARTVWERIIEKGGWASFGYIAAEADLLKE